MGAGQGKNSILVYRDLLVWQKAMSLVTQIYQQTGVLPKDELYGLTSQIRRSAVSIPANIAEGYGRNSTQDYIRFLRIANGSLFELETLLEICRNLSFIGEQECSELFEQMQELERMLGSLITKVGKRYKGLGTEAQGTKA
ncbi:MAG: four helix bundle protein [Desulfobulbaceae bacterium]